MEVLRVAVIGGGAAGIFSAISVKKHFPNANVTVFEKSTKLLSKVKVSGGGRCNVTHNQLNIKHLAKNYPRGENFLKKAFSQFSVEDTISWFNNRGVELKVESDNRMFPISNSSQTIIDAFLTEIQKQKIEVVKDLGMKNLVFNDSKWSVTFSDDSVQIFDKIIVAIGGQKRRDRFQIFESLGHHIIEPVPSLFTFNVYQNNIVELMGLAATLVNVKIQGSKFQNTGPLLITHWGFSGPAILKLSALAARYLANKNYEFKIQLNWLGEIKEEKLREELSKFIAESGNKLVNKCPFDLPNRLWIHFLKTLQIDTSISWNSFDKKSKNRIINKVLNDEYQIYKTTTFKEEFVICGGISLAEVNSKSMESKITPGLYYAGEILDIDGVTGGFNFQSAWTTGFIAGKLGC